MTRLLKLTAPLVLAAFAALAAAASLQAKSGAACTERSYPGQPPKHTDDLRLQPKYN